MNAATETEVRVFQDLRTTLNDLAPNGLAPTTFGRENIVNMGRIFINFLGEPAKPTPEIINKLIRKIESLPNAGT